MREGSDKPDGSFGGLVFATISLDHFSELFSVVDVGPGGVISLRDGELKLIARYPEFKQLELGMGSKLSSTPFKQAFSANPEKGTYYSGSSSIDNTPRVHSYLKFKDYPLYINVGIADDYLLATWRKEVWEIATLNVAFILASALFSFLLVRALNRHQASEEELFLQKEYLQAIYEAEPECVKVVGAEGNLLDMNPAGLKMLEVDSLDEAQRSGLLAYIEPDYRDAFIALHKRIFAGNSGTLEFPVTGKKGTRRWLETHATPLRDENGNVVSLLGVTRDVTERRTFQQQLEQQAHVDSLTGLYNRGYFMQQAELELSRAARYGSDLSIFMLDIDFFKQVNDSHGHKVGDTVLMKLADICRKTLREVDLIGRVGGEEFAMLLPETDKNEAADVAERLRSNIENSETPLENGLPIHFTVSIGVASLGSRDENLDVLLNKADTALYEAKKTGRNKVCVDRK